MVRVIVVVLVLADFVVHSADLHLGLLFIVATATTARTTHLEINF